MKNLSKNLILFIVLSISISSFLACTDSGATGIDKPDSDKKTEKADNVATKDEFPPAPEAIVNAELKALEGDTFKISDYKGKVVLVNLWATWCGPCIKEMPEFIKLIDKYGDQGFVVIGLNTDDEGSEQIKAFAKKQNLNYKLGWSDRNVTQEFFKISKLSGIPQSIIINRNGNMTGVFRGGGENVIKKMIETVDETMAKK